MQRSDLDDEVANYPKFNGMRVSLLNKLCCRSRPISKTCGSLANDSETVSPT